MKLSLAITTPDVEVPIGVALLSGTFSEKIKKAARLGYDGVELMVARPEIIEIGPLLRELKTSGLQVSAIASGAIYTAEGCSLLAAEHSVRSLARAKLSAMILLAAETGAGLVTIGSFRGRLAWAGGSPARDYLLETIREAADQAYREGVRLALEPLNRYETDLIHNALEGMDFIQEVNSPILGLLLDTYHMNIEEANPIHTAQQALADGRLLHVHIADNNRLPPGEGHIDFSGLVDTLQAGGYQGFLSAELFGKADPDQAAQATIAYMRPLLLA